MPDITHHTIPTNGIDMHIAEAGEGPLVVMLHGFPELWYSWRHQLPALADAGYHAVAPDLRGYGRTDAPPETEAYSMREMTADVVGILDALGEEQAVVVGHDWGAPIAWTSAILYPQRFRAVVALSVPYVPRGPAPPTQMMRRIFVDRFFYILYFQEPGLAEAELEADIRRFLKLCIYTASGDSSPEVDQRRRGLLAGKPKDARLFDDVPEPERLPPWLTEADLDVYTAEFRRTGFRGPLNRYRNMDRDWEELPELADLKVQQPALFITGERDGATRMTPQEGMRTHVLDLRKEVMLPACGHWTQQERPQEVNAELIEFLRSL